MVEGVKDLIDGRVRCVQVCGRERESERETGERECVLRCGKGKN